MKRALSISIAVFCVCAWGYGLGADTARADTLGQTQSFFVDSSYDVVGASSVPATVRAAGQHGYFYVDDRYWNALTPDQQQRYVQLVSQLSAEFDGVIYPRLTAFWGNENTPGIDHDAHVVVLLEQLNDGSGGYFQTVNNYNQQRAPDSNAREMVYIDAESVGTGLAKYFLTHELQHLISFNQKEIRLNVREDVWLNEGRSEYSNTVAGYNVPFSGSMLEKRMWAFLQSPSDSLTEWPNTSNDYGIAAVFMQYLADQYGPGMIAATIHTSTAGVASIDDALSTMSVPERMDEVFVNWMVAASVNDRGADPRFGYTSAGLNTMHVIPAARVQLGALRDQIDMTSLLKEWQPFWFEADISSDATLADTVDVRIAGGDQARWRGAIVARYANNAYTVTRLPETGMVGTDIAVPSSLGGSRIHSIMLAVAQVSDIPPDGRTMVVSPVSMTVGLQALPAPIAPAPLLAPQLTAPIDGDLIRRIGQAETYVIWGGYRRYLSAATLRLYGFQNRIVREVPDAVFLKYTTSNYIRAESQKKVYAVWPDGTKHWLNISAAQWDASGRDWGAIFTVNDAEVASYQTGNNIVH